MNLVAALSFLLCLCCEMAVAQTDSIKILTPLGNQPNDDDTPNSIYMVYDSAWDESQIERCRQAALYTGGLFKVKDDAAFKEMNNYLDGYSQTVWCMETDGDSIYIGTDDGIRLSTDYGETWLDKDEDGIDDNLVGIKVNSIRVGLNRIFAGTDDGLYYSTDRGDNWTQKYQGKDISCIEFGNNNDVYAGAGNGGVFKSTNSGDSWNETGLTLQYVYCLKYDGNNLFAGSEKLSDRGFLISTDGGDNWESLWTDDLIYCIHIKDSSIYIGTKKNGCLKSTDGGNTFDEINNGFPEELFGEYHPLYSLNEKDSCLYAATAVGLYNKTYISTNWEKSTLKDKNYYSANEETKPKMVYADESADELWIACYGNVLWESAEMVESESSPSNPSNFRNFNCHTYAWHFSEGGTSGVILPHPGKSMNYCPGTKQTEMEKKNWDYIEIGFGSNFFNEFFEKVTYEGANHSGIRDSDHLIGQDDNEEDLMIISKWSQTGASC